ncbi:hypothetical protein C8J57DRAFT_1250748 [Mycena rebaudengoi]|nr:hypothetical protein C8J57DRAFT_1250748 [Mycena rebaudengoi]
MSMWFPQERKTRSGTTFSPFWPLHATTLQASTFDVAPLLRASAAQEAALDCDDLDNNLDNEPDDSLDDTLPHGACPAHLPPERDASCDFLAALDEPAPPPSPPPPSQKRTCTMAERIASEKPVPHRHAKRRRRRDAAIESAGQAPHAATIYQQVFPNQAIPTALDANDLPTATHGAYAAKVESDTYGCKKRRTLAELLALGFQLVPWDGFHARPIVDVHGRIIAVLAHQPSDPTYSLAVQRAFAAMSMEAATAQFPVTFSQHRRGHFPALNAGLLYGKGQTVPSHLDNHQYTPIVHRLLAHRDIKRMAIYASAAFNLWAPKIHAYYQQHDHDLRAHLPHLRCNFRKSVFSSAAFNFGPNVWTFKHRDVLNVPFGMCAVQAMGSFNATTGDHLILWDLKLVIEFPAGATILLPSATVCHSNLPVQAGKRRGSFMQYTSGGLMHYIDNGFHTEKELAVDDPVEYARICRLKEERWEMGLGLFSTVEELLEAANVP